MRILLVGSVLHLVRFNVSISFPMDQKIWWVAADMVHSGPGCAPFSRIPLERSAARLFSRWQAAIGLICLALLALAVLIAPFRSLQVVVALLSTLYLLDILFSFILISRALVKDPVIKVPAEARMPDWELPFYTILCPLFHEATIVPQFVRAMKRLDYPAHKLQIILLLEANDAATRQAIGRLQLPPQFEVLIVPPGQPQTKPRACNVGLQHALGDLIVIYDAEDIPEPKQLRTVAAAFQTLPPDVVCIQAKLDFYNRGHNLLTRLFTAEYALLFNLVLIGLQSVHGPIPLGGTSNHFRADVLRRIGGWDPYNVTEDCDLGIRLFEAGFRTAIVDSTTYEEANSQLHNWIRQRSRWIKGYLQTVLVHTRNPQRFWTSLRTLPHFGTFLLVVGGKPLATLINPLLWIITLSYFLGSERWQEAIESVYLGPVFYFAFFAGLIGNFLQVLYYVVALAQRGYPELIKFFPLVPIYWVLMSVAGWKAVGQLFIKPHFWEKTVHGFHLTDEPSRSLPARWMLWRRLVREQYENA